MKEALVTPVIALILGQQLRARVARAIEPNVDLVFCERGPQLRERVATYGAMAVITQLVDASGADTRPVIRRLHERLPEISIILIHDHPTPDEDALLELGKLGFSFSVNHSTRDFGSSLRTALARAEEQSAAAAIARRVLPLVPTDLRPWFVHCTHAATRPLLAEAAARKVGFPPRSLRALMSRSGLPSPQRIIRWNRLLHACWRLDMSGRPVKAVSVALGYDTDVALRKHSVRLTGLQIGEVLSRGGFRYLLDLFEHELRGKSTPPEARR
jgi:AraC-like DNA-binding protein